MEATIKEIISVFTKIPVEEIVPSTPVDRSAVKSSILLQRMYAKLATAGIIVENYADIKVFADLLRNVNGSTGPVDGQVIASPLASLPDLAEGHVGIDMEEIAAMPKTHDFRKEAFYVMNFTAGEMAYCILQSDPYSSFAGLFAAKEAIIKADGRYRSKTFNTIEIGHASNGKPLHSGFSLSISHAGGMAVAVAVSSAAGGLHRQEPEIPGALQQVPAGERPFAFRLTLLALLLSILALIIMFIRRA